MKPARYIFLNQGLGMSPGKIGAQAAHAETLAMYDYLKSPVENDISWMHDQSFLYDKWLGDGHYAKYVMKANDTQMMYTIERYLNERDFKTYIVIDEGHTEDTYMVPTAMSVELVDKDDERIESIFSQFRMYRERRPEPRDTSQSESGGWWPWLRKG